MTNNKNARRSFLSLLVLGAAGTLALAAPASAMKTGPGVHPNSHKNGPAVVAPAVHGTVVPPIHVLRKTGVTPLKRI